jgi:hypothetical protein
VLGSRVVLDVGTTSVGTDRELDTVAFELTTESDRVDRGGVLVQEVDLLEGQTLGLKIGYKFPDDHQGGKGK